MDQILPTFDPPSPSSGKKWTFYILSNLCHVTHMDFFLTPLLPLFVHVVIECPQWVLHVACLCLVRSWQESRTKLSFGACTMAQCYPFGLQIDLKILGQKRSNLSLISDQPQINLRSISVSRFFCQIIIGSQLHSSTSNLF